MAERKQVDWESVERDYSAGLLSLREIAAKYGVSPSLITRKKNEGEWPRDLTSKIQAKADSIITGVNIGGVNTGVNSKKASEKEIIEVNAQAIVNIKLAHRGDIRKSKNIVNSLFDELELTTDNRELFEQLGEMLRNESDSGQDKLNDIYKKVISLPQRIDGVKKLTDALKTMIGLERQAFGITDAPTPTDDAIKDLLKGLGSNALNTKTTFDLDDDE